MIIKFLKLLLSKPMLTLRLAHPRRIRNAFFSLIQNRGNLSQLYKRYEDIYSSPGGEKLHASLLSEAQAQHPKGDIFILPVIDWGFRHQRPQHLSLCLGKLGYRVFYFSAAPEISEAASGYRLAESPSDGVFVCKFLSDSAKIEDIHRDVMSEKLCCSYQVALQQLMDDLGVVSPVMLLNHSYWMPLAELFPNSLLGYDCMDHHAAFLDPAFEGVPFDEQRLIERADFVITSSTYLAEKIGHSRESRIVRNGCDYTFFSAIPSKNPSRIPVAGYVGAIAEWFDMDLLVDVAIRLPHWQFVLVGSTVGCDIQKARKCINIVFVGEVSYGEVPSYISQFDVCMIPFKLTELTKATNPVKVYEYLAAGRPVVSTPLPEVVEMNGMALTAQNAKEFAEHLVASLEWSHDEEVCEARKSWAAKQDWMLRAQAIEEEIISCVGESIG